MNKYLKVNFSLNTDLAGDFKSEYFTNTLNELKLIGEAWSKEADEENEFWDETYFVDFYYVSGPKDEFNELKNYLDNL